MATASAEELQGRPAPVTGRTGDTGSVIVEHLRRHGAEVWTAARWLPSGHPDPHQFIAAGLSTAEGADTVAAHMHPRGRPGHSGPPARIHPPAGSPPSTTNSGRASCSESCSPRSASMAPLVPAIIHARRGVVAHISSIQRKMPLGNGTLADAGSKAALTTYSKGLATEVARTGSASTPLPSASSAPPPPNGSSPASRPATAAPRTRHAASS
jgi:NAD(P)-dependent dehydrogenase (short-subunit alcohol dehydrogenase family)